MDTCKICHTECPKANKIYRIQIMGTRSDLLYGPCRQTDCCEVEIIETPDQLSAKADICLISGLHYLLPDEYLNIPRLGIWGFHETNLPIGRGCAPLQWTVINGIGSIWVTFFHLESKMDSGVFISQRSKNIEKTDLLSDLRSKADKIIVDMIEDCLPSLLHGERLIHKSQESWGTPVYYRKRTSEDSRLNPSKSLNELWDLIRVCDPEKFPAFFEIEGKKIYLKAWK